MPGIDVGLKFLPRDDELVLGYLLKKVKGEPLPSADVDDCEIYGDKEPWKIFGKTSKKSYVFTKLKKKGRARRIERRAGCGTWKGQNTNPVKDSQNKHVGFKKLFVFEVKGSGTSNADNGHWIMHEYSLVNDQSDYVLCAIRNKRGIDVVEDDELQRKRMRCNEDEQNSVIEAPTPISTLASDEALGFAATPNAFIEPTPASTLAPDHEALMGWAAAPNCEVGSSTNEEFASRLAALDRWLSEDIDRELSEAEVARQVLLLNASVSFQQQSMVTTAAEPVSTSVSALALEYFDTGASAPALDFDSEASAMAFYAEAEPTAAPTLPLDEASGFVAASNAFTEPNPASTLAPDHEALMGLAAAPNCEDGSSTNEKFAISLAELDRWLSEDVDRELSEAEVARQVQISNASVSFQQPSMVTTAAEPVSTSVSAPALEYFDSGGSAMAFDAGAETAPAPTLPLDEASGFVAASNSFTEATPVASLAPDHEALTGFAAASNCEDHGLLSIEQFANSPAKLMPKGFDKALFEAEDARQVLIPNESVQATIALELNRSLQQKHGETSSTTAEESVSTSVSAPALESFHAGASTSASDFGSRASAMAFDLGAVPYARLCFPNVGNMSFLEYLMLDDTI